jgi:hypothetical protein
MGDLWFLLAHPSFGRGAASAIDLGGVFVRYNQSRSDDAADCVPCEPTLML